jgi:hypothetical protein
LQRILVRAVCRSEQGAEEHEQEHGQGASMGHATIIGTALLFCSLM